MEYGKNYDISARGYTMTSPTDITERCRAAKKAAMGHKRKKALRKAGSTPQLFTLNKPVQPAKPAAKTAKKTKKEENA
jgi:hypothetical protein